MSKSNSRTRRDDGPLLEDWRASKASGNRAKVLLMVPPHDCHDHCVGTDSLSGVSDRPAVPQAQDVFPAVLCGTYSTRRRWGRRSSP